MNQGFGLKRVQILTHFLRARYFLVRFFLARDHGFLAG